MKAIETVKTTSRSNPCSGDGASKHPLVYLDIAPNADSVVCPYCSKTFVLKK
jgi:uncharacterized Zn-finger protein